MMLGAGESPTPFDTIRLRDDRHPRQAASERAPNSAVASARLAEDGQRPLPHLRYSYAAALLSGEVQGIPHASHAHRDRADGGDRLPGVRPVARMPAAEMDRMRVAAQWGSPY